MRCVCWLVAMLVSGVHAREIHVTPSGNDVGPGTVNRPYRTISRAAAQAQPGDTVTVHAGTYRERVAPQRGGTAVAPITYRAAPGETVWIKGSERVTTWRRDPNGLWTATLPNARFGPSNPYALQVSGGWLNYGQWHHRGDVFVRGEALLEQRDVAAVRATKGTWCCAVDADTTRLWIHVEGVNPNTALTEINVRASLFMPRVSGLSYIRVQGLHFAHAACNWAPPVIPLQPGAIGPRLGKGWVIEDCTVEYARCVGIILGQAPGVDTNDIDAYGAHIVRNNVIRRCGQAGIAGQKGATRSLICGNRIEETNDRREFGGWETAAIKFHNSVDTVICGNFIRGVYRQIQGAFGIWMDFGNQGTRITRNLILDTEAATLFLEMDHGPTLVDNNVFIGQSVRSNSEATVFAHNLFVDCGTVYHPDRQRRSQYFRPHTTVVVGRKTGTAADDRWYHNIFVGRGLDDVKPAPGYAADYNIYLGGARPSAFGDAHGVTDSLVPEIAVADTAEGLRLSVTVDEVPRRLPGPRVDAGLVGVFATVGQTIEDAAGRPLAVDRDILGRPFAPPVAGPLAELHAGVNTIPWPLPAACPPPAEPRVRPAGGAGRSEAWGG